MPTYISRRSSSQLGRLEGFAVRQDAFLDADQEDMLVFQPLGGVQRRQLDGVDILARSACRAC
jgi:hypothetical protein